MNLAIIGGGSTYTPELIHGLIEARQALSIGRICLMDIDAERLDIVGRFAQRMALAAGSALHIELTTDRKEALTGVDYVLTQIRVGGMPARIQDERIPLRHGAIGQETTGPGGFAKALRTIPVLLDLADDLSRLSPNARLINFTNPSGLITEALLKYASIEAIGLCNSPIGAQRALCDHFQVAPARLRLDWVGLNHLSWIRGVWIDEADVLDRALEFAIEEGWGTAFEPSLIRGLRMIPSYYLEYYYNTDQVLAKQQSTAIMRGEEVLEIEKQLLAMYADSALATKPAILDQRGGAHYSTAAVDLLHALEGRDATQILNAANRGSLPGLPDDAVVEVPCRIREGAVRSEPCAPMPPTIRGLVQRVKAYEELTIEAAVSGDASLAVHALNAHPLVPSYAIAQRIWRDLRDAHAAHLPQFAKHGGIS